MTGKKEERNPGKNKHLTEEGRRTIEDCFVKHMTFKAIGELIGKDPTTVSYEIRHHRKIHLNDFVTSQDTCPELLHAPCVLNGCQRKSSRACKFAHFYCRANAAQKEYRELLTDALEGTLLNSLCSLVHPPPTPILFRPKSRIFSNFMIKRLGFGIMEVQRKIGILVKSLHFGMLTMYKIELVHQFKMENRWIKQAALIYVGRKIKSEPDTTLSERS